MRRLRFIPAALAVVVVCSTGVAQSQTKQEASGTVTGHVYCDDTNGPARLARVVLEPAKEVSDAARAGTNSLSSWNSVQSGLDGSFTIKDVKPGMYYVIAELPGYLSSLSSFSEEELQDPTAALAGRMAKVLQRVSVEAGRTAVVNVSLERGAAVSGTIIFDDGSPAVGTPVKALREKSDGSWETELIVVPHPFRGGGEIVTNDMGQYRIAGLGAGHYVIEADLSLSAVSVTSRVAEDTGMGNLSFFSGGKLRATKDAAFALTVGESRPGEDIVIPLSKLHSVSGTVVTANDGRPVKNGEVSLLYGDDQKELTTAMVDRETGEFRLYLVPEGHFILKVNVEVTGAGRADDSATPYRYSPLQQPLDVNGDVDGLVLSLQEAGATPAAAQIPESSQ